MYIRSMQSFAQSFSEKGFACLEVDIIVHANSVAISSGILEKSADGMRICNSVCLTNTINE